MLACKHAAEAAYAFFREVFMKAYGWQSSIGVKSILKAVGSCLLVAFIATTSVKAIPIIGGFVPTANAGADQYVYEGQSVGLDGSNSFVIDLDNISYQWQQVSGPVVALFDANAVSPSFVAPAVGPDGDSLVFQLNVSDGLSLSAPSFVSIYVAFVNRPPVANAGSGQAVNQNALVTLDASASFDPDSNPLTYSWSQTSGPIVTLDLSNPIHPSFIAPVVSLSGASFQFSLIVSDGFSLSIPASVSVLVNNPDRAPVAIAGTDFVANERAIVQLNGSGSFDPDGDSLTYNWTQVSGPVVELIGSRSVSPNFLAPEVASAGAIISFQLVASDAFLQSAASTVNVQINNVNRAPIANAGVNQVADQRTIVNLDGSSSFDPDGDPLSFQWSQISGPLVSLSMSTLPNPSFSVLEVPLAGAVFGFVLSVSDGSITNTSPPVFIKVNYVNRPPVAIAGSDQTVFMQSTVNLDGTGSFDPDKDSLTYSWSQIGGPNVILNLSNPARPTFVAPAVAVGGATITFSLIVNDGQLSSLAALVNIDIKNVNHAPIASAGAAQTLTAGATANLNASDSYDPDGDALTFLWSQVSGPTVTINNPNSAFANFTAPALLTSTNLSFKVLVSDGQLSGSALVVITVQKQNLAPIANAGSPQTVQTTDIVTLDASGSFDPNGDQITYLWSQIGGPVAIMDSNNMSHSRLVAPDVPIVTQLTFSLVVSDGLLSSQASTVTITVNPTTAPPICNLAIPNKSVLWPPNHKLQQIDVLNVFEVGHEHDLGNKIIISKISQDEPTNGLGDGDTPIDGVIKTGYALIRQERQGGSNGRVYVISFTASNSYGVACTGSVKICVPLAANSKTCKNDGQKYDSTK